MALRFEILALGAAFTAALWAMHRRHRARVAAERGACFDECLTLFERYRLTRDDVDFPVLEGVYRGHRVRLEPVVDHIVMRKMPSLWLLVTVFGEVPYAGVFDLLMRPQNTEFYSPSGELEHTVELPPGWPRHALIRTDRPDALPPADRLTRHIVMFDDPKTKELLISPRGVRIVYQANQAERAHYLVLRQAEFRNVTLARDLVQNLLDRALAVLETLCAERGEHEAGARDTLARSEHVGE